MLPADLTGEGPDMGVAEAVLGRLADGELVIIDGGMGSQLQAEGVPMDGVAWSARANLDQPEAVQRVHEEFIGGRRRGDHREHVRGQPGRRWDPPGWATGWPRPTAAPCARPGRPAQAAAARPVAVAGSMSSFCPHRHGCREHLAIR